jgi:hypothetical protein
MGHKASAFEGLGEKIYGLLFRVNRKDLDETRLDPFSKVMVLLIDMPSTRAHSRCLGQVDDGSSMIFKEFAADNWHGLGDVSSLLLHLLE